MKVLLTGGFGYLGGRIASSLRAKGYTVVLSGREVPAPASRFAADYEFRRCDVLDERQPDGLLRDVDAIVHLASLDEKEAEAQPARAALVSGEGTRLMLGQARAAGVTRFIFFSTFHVYGPTALERVTEDTPTKAAHPYAIAHLLGEGFCRAAKALGQDVIIARVSNGYGAPQWTEVDRWSLALNDFTRQAASTGRIVLRSSGLQHRDFVGVEDVAEATDIMLGASTASVGEGVFNVGGMCSLSIHDVALKVQAIARARSRIDCPIERPLPGAQHTATPVDFRIDRLRALGYAPTDWFERETIRLFDLLQRSDR